jgi:tetratricopeptide (TPR) repeat protein
MKSRGIALVFTCLLIGVGESAFVSAQRGSATVDWKAELAKAKAGIEREPKSAFWHNQAGVAYDALGDFESAVKELKLASSLDSSNPMDDYALYALYKRRGMHTEQREVLLRALEKDPRNPLGRFEFAWVLEDENHWADALREYRTAKALVTKIEGPQYVDPRGNPYEIGGVRNEVDRAIDRVLNLNQTRTRQNPR